MDINDAINKAIEEEKETIKDVTEKVKQDITNSFESMTDSTVTIDLHEYIELTLKAADHDRLLHAIVDNFELNYSREGLRVRGGEDLADVIKILYPNAYKLYLRTELAKAKA